MAEPPVERLPSQLRAVAAAAFVAWCILVGLAADLSPGLAEDRRDGDAPATVATTELEPGWNLAGWLGPPVPASDLFGAIPALKVIYTWDPAGQAYRRYARASAPQEALLLETGMGLWLYLSGDEPFEWERPIAPQGVVLPL